MLANTRRVPGFVAVFFTIAIASTTPADAELCADAIPVDANAIFRGDSASAGGVETFALDVPRAGTVALEITVPGSTTVLPKLARLQAGHGCHPLTMGQAKVIERTASHLVLAVSRPGRFLFRAAARDPRQALGAYRLHTSGVILAKSEPEEVDPNPGKSEPEEVDPNPGLLGFPADHSDARQGATVLALGRSLTGEIDNDWGDDADVFELVLERQTSIEISASAETDLIATLTDSLNRRLAIHDSRGEGESLRLVETLPPGRYFLRLEGAQGAEGSYSLTATALEW